MSKVSVIIPTLLKNINILNQLITLLSADYVVDEIIIINNSKKSFLTDNKKVRVFSQQENLYVNPSWNYGIKMAKNDLCALFNDDLLVCKDFCTQISELIAKENNFGVCGMDDDFIHNTKNIIIPQTSKIILKKDELKREIHYWGSIIFIKQKDWVDIPKKLKIYFGDNFIRLIQNKNGKNVLKISNVSVSHLGSLSSSNKKFNSIKREDALFYLTLDPSIKNNKGYNSLIQTSFQNRLYKIIRFLFQKKITKSGVLSVKIFKIPIYRSKIK